MYNYHDIFFYYAFGALNGGGGSIQVIGITEGTTSVTFKSNGKPLITYRIYGSSSGVGDLNAETGKYDITVTCNEDTYTISLDAPLMDGEYIDYKTQRLYPSGLDVSMPEISTIEGTNTLTVITTNPSSKVYVECYRAKDVPILSANVVIGSVPFDFECYEAWHLMDYSISGNAVQGRTPSSEAPVDAAGCGVRTGNLFDITTLENGIYLAASGNKYGDATNGVRAGTKIKVLPNTAYTISAQSSANVSLRIFEWSNGTFTRQTPKYNISGSVSLTVTTTAETTEIAFNIEGENGQYATNVMLNLGSTPLPYEPYGFKLPLTVNGTEYPIYLGQVETTRRIKKQNVTISYMIQLANGNAGAVTESFPIAAASSGLSKCNIAPYGGSNSIGSFYVNPKNAVFVCAPGTTVSEARILLSGAVIWYLMAEPETGIVNEPLMKLGDYADTITFNQAGVNIPVIEGNNVLTINTDVLPSETYIKYNGKEKEYGYYITSDGYIYTTSDGYKYGIRS